MTKENGKDCHQEKRSPMASQNGIEEELLHQGRVPGITNDEAPKVLIPATPTVAAPSPQEVCLLCQCPWKYGTSLEVMPRDRNGVKGPEAAKLWALTCHVFSCFITWRQ